MLRKIFALFTLLLAACSSTIPSAADMERYYALAEQQAQRDIDRLTERRSLGEISVEEYQRREEAIRESIPKRASQMAWARHELSQSEMRSLGLPTPDGPGVQVAAPTRGSVSGSFYRQPGQEGLGYQGLNPGRGMNSQLQSMMNSIGTTN